MTYIEDHSGAFPIQGFCLGIPGADLPPFGGWRTSCCWPCSITGAAGRFGAWFSGPGPGFSWFPLSTWGNVGWLWSPWFFLEPPDDRLIWPVHFSIFFPQGTSSANSCEKDMSFSRLGIPHGTIDPAEIMPTVEKQPDSTNCALV